jgi:thiol-disulfide isomerase/thioredoxin
MNRRQTLLALTSAACTATAAAGVLDWYNGVKLGAKLPEHDAEFLGTAPQGEFKLMLIDFWATWCAPCRDEFPHLNTLHSNFSEQGLLVLGLTKESRAVAEAFLPKVQINYALGVGGQRPLQQSLGIKALPYALLVDRTRTIVWRGQASTLLPEEVARRLSSAA